MSDQTPETPPSVPRPRKATTKPRNTGTTKTTDSDVPKPPPTVPRERTRDDAKLAESVKSMYEGIGMLALGVGMSREDDNPFLQFASNLMTPAMEASPTGELIPGRTGADRITDAWMVAADRNPRVKQALKRFTEGGAFAELIALHIGLLMPFLPALSGAIPGIRRGTPDPATNGAAGPLL